MSAIKNTDTGLLEVTLVNYITPFLNGICDFIKAGSRNDTVNEDKMVYCNAPLAFYDLNAYGKTRMRIEIYVKDIGGYKNITDLSTIRNAIVDKLNGINIDNKYFIQYINEMSNSDNAGFHFIFLNLEVTTV